MPTEDQMLSGQRGANLDGIPAQTFVTKKVAITVNGNTTVKAQVVLPAGSIFRSITLDTPTAISGSPSSSNFRAGTSDTGQQVVADVDAKAQGHISATIVAALDKVGGFSASNTTLYLQVTTAGGTSSAGTIYALVSYDAPVF